MVDILRAAFDGKNDQLSIWLKRWNKIKFFADEDADLDPSSTNYQYFTHCLNRFLNGRIDFKFKIGSFELPKNKSVTVAMFCMETLKNKCISFSINEKEIYRIIIECDTLYNYKNIKKCIKVCESLNLLNACKSCSEINLNNLYNNNSSL